MQLHREELDVRKTNNHTRENNSTDFQVKGMFRNKVSIHGIIMGTKIQYKMSTLINQFTQYKRFL